MPISVFQKQYRDETVAIFERKRSFLTDTVVTDTVKKGDQTFFLVAGANGVEASTRGLDGRIPYKKLGQSQVAVTMREWHAAFLETTFDITASQGDQRALMQRGTVSVINRKLDSLIIDALDTTTASTGAPVVATPSLIEHALGYLGSQEAINDGVTCVITPAFYSKMAFNWTQFANSQYSNIQPMDKMLEVDRGFASFRWAGINFIVHTGLPGAGTANEHCFMYSKNAIGLANDTANMTILAGFDEKEGHSWARAESHAGAGVIQSSGIIMIQHDGSSFAAQAVV